MYNRMFKEQDSTLIVKYALDKGDERHGKEFHLIIYLILLVNF